MFVDRKNFYDLILKTFDLSKIMDLFQNCGLFRVKAIRGVHQGPHVNENQNFFIKIVHKICTFWVVDMKIAKNGILALKPVPKHDYV